MAQHRKTSDESKTGLSPNEVYEFIEGVFGEDLHAKRVLSLANGVSGVQHAAALSIHAIGQGLAAANGTNPRHAVKQVDRLLSAHFAHRDQLSRFP